jgi:hypothetical protein
MIKSAFLLFSVVCLANRVLFGVEEYMRLSLERSTDLYMYAMCEQVDYKKIGRHAQLCADLEHRLSNGIMFHTVKAVVDDTLYREATLQSIAQLGLMIILVILGSSMYGRYVKHTVDYNLPTSSKSLKVD